MRALIIFLLTIQASTAANAAELLSTWDSRFSYDACQTYSDSGRKMYLYDDGTCTEADYRCTWRIEDGRFHMEWTGYPGYGVVGYILSDGLMQGPHLDPTGTAKLCWRAVRLSP